ncbi:MAG: glycoside hydrolase [Acidobacteriota bacterium]|nr:glycoside hydrolase [Acidobacteriota bacterium]
MILLLGMLAEGAAIACAAQAPSTSNAALRQGFASPPPQARLRCYWWWLNGNTTEETITRDLTEMSRKGFGGVLLVDANGSSQNGNDNVPAGPTFGSPAWVRLYVHALKVAAQFNLDVTLNITSGWNLGGPDVTPDQASKLLTWSRTGIEAGKAINGLLAMPPAKNGFYRDIAVLAYPLNHGLALPGETAAGRPAIRALKFKTASMETGISMPPSQPLLEDVPSTPGEQDTDLQNVIDVSAKMDKAGRLDWQPPSGGAWEILRIGFTDSDARVSTASGAWQGLAIDYLDRGAFDTYWDHTVAPLLELARPYLKSTLKYLATDSWEVGGTNWTARFAEEFRTRRGYDPLRYLPIVAGRIVDDRAASDRFLNDLRRTVGDLITDHYDHFSERAKAYGLGTQCESGGPHGAPMDALETFRSATVPQSEYWAQSAEHRSSDEDRFFVKEAASAANIYGKQLVAQEGMTSIGPQWSESLATDLKPTFDQALTEGMNRLVWHQFTSSPKSFGVPGNEYFAGTHLNPNVTWWDQAEPFFRYLNRSQWLMQQGHAVNDVLYFYGDEVPNFVRLKQDDPAHVLPGYDYDVTNEDALLHSLTLHDGVLSSPAGNIYRLLVLPTGRRLSLAALKRIAMFVEQGGSVAGLEPLGPTGNPGQMDAEKFTHLAKALWDSCAIPSRTYGRGTVICGTKGREAMQALKVPADFEDASGKLDYVHRADQLRDIYFVRNGGALAVDTVVGFRVSGRAPEIWDAVSGAVLPQMRYDVEGAQTRLPLHLDAYGSAFVIFERESALHLTQVVKDGTAVNTMLTSASERGGFVFQNASPGSYQGKLSDGRRVTAQVREKKSTELPASQWSIAFQADRGAPQGDQKLKAFESWSDSKDQGIRYFSGTATYRTSIIAKPAPDERVFLQLTDLREICTVRINGKNAGTIWAMPYRLDITDSLAEGSNTIELEVTNLWPNRIIGDAQPSATKTYTKTNIRKYTKDSPLLPSGLIGPVSLDVERVARFNIAEAGS